MPPRHHVGAAAPGLAAPERSEKNDARELGGGAGIMDQSETADLDFRSNGLADEAALTIEGEAYVHAYLARLQADAVQPVELATLMAFLTGEMLYGACRAIEKALRGVQHA